MKHSEALASGALAESGAPDIAPSWGALVAWLSAAGDAVGARDGESDAALATRAQRGDLDAFEALVARCEAGVFALLRRVMGCREDAEDVTQETFLAAYRALGSYDASRPFRPWLYRIAMNRALSELRRARPRRVALEDVAEELLVQPEVHGGVEPELAAHLRRAVGELKPEDAALLHLRYAEEQSIEQIAEVLGKRANTVAVALHRLRETLRRALSGAEGGFR